MKRSFVDNRRDNGGWRRNECMQRPQNHRRDIDMAVEPIVTAQRNLTQHDKVPTGFDTCLGEPRRENYLVGGSYEATEENREWLSQSAVASLINISSLSNLQAYFMAEGVCSITIRSMGCNSDLLTFESIECMEKFLNDKLWVPLGGLDFFQWFGGKLGDFISIDGSTLSRKKFDSAHLLIITDSQEFVNKVVTVDLNKNIFFISAIKEPCYNPLSLFCQKFKTNCPSFSSTVGVSDDVEQTSKIVDLSNDVDVVLPTFGNKSNANTSCASPNTEA
ncbi:hypothetical protein GH714_030589 [Hevea brasiliensis]|uniref:Uncharacterized protein n=1 Tax=Hevea brasiliensis TaxID=3981 RepID=A0A6A6NDE9_HEVBR|nr:hypothetical protein GH714_030589 [Hevea brasiliensis]